MTDFASARETMVERQIAARGITDPRILDAFRAVPREAFVPDDQRHSAYDDNPLPIEAGQTVSQPRQSRQRSRCWRTASVGSIFPSARPSMSWMRPRGLSPSWPVWV